MNDLLFVYGTLLNADNKYAAYLRSNSAFYAHGKLQAQMYNIGKYPGTVLSDKDDEFVFGSIYRVSDALTVLPVIDVYEGFGDDQPQPNEFIREIVTIQTDAGDIACWIYLYNLPVDGLPQIATGRWLL